MKLSSNFNFTIKNPYNLPFKAAYLCLQMCLWRVIKVGVAFQAFCFRLCSKSTNNLA